MFQFWKPAPPSRAVLVVGMHRSGTSAVTRGLQALSVYLGNDFLDVQPENPKGYWEDKGIVGINERVLAALGLKWDDVSPIDVRKFQRPRVRALHREAIRYVRRSFRSQPLWGFKDPRTIRILPFWCGVLHDSNVRDAYVVAIRHPLSIAASLLRRQATDAGTAFRLWLVNVVPFFSELREKPLVVVDYDLLVGDPRPQLERVARALDLPVTARSAAQIDEFAAHFLDADLRHSTFSPNEFESDSDAGRLAARAFLALYGLAVEPAAVVTESFWQEWASIAEALETARYFER
ncbi:MAG TPA: sulfotransferase [Candidatus Tumulicola sp.]|jgi:hypothetical protein